MNREKKHSLNLQYCRSKTQPIELMDLTYFFNFERLKVLQAFNNANSAVEVSEQTNVDYYKIQRYIHDFYYLGLLKRSKPLTDFPKNKRWYVTRSKGKILFKLIANTKDKLMNDLNICNKYIYEKKPK